MSAFSTVGDVFTDPEFAAPGNSLLWGLGGLDDTYRECTGSSSCPGARTDGESTLTAATSMTTPSSALDPVTRQLTFLFIFTCAPPTCLALTASCAVPRPSKGAWIELRVSTSANGSASNSHSIQHHDLPVPSVRENIMSSHSLVATWPHARASDPFFGPSQQSQRVRASPEPPRCDHFLH